MTILIVATEPSIEALIANLVPNGRVVQYTHPLKALDNIREIKPDLILWNVDDFPRHWKPFVSSTDNQEQSADMILVCEKDLASAESDKAKALSVKKIISQGFFGNDLSNFLEGISKSLPSTASSGFSPVSLPDSKPLLVIQTGAAILLHKVYLGPLEIEAELVPAHYLIKKKEHSPCKLYLASGKSEIELEGFVKWSKTHNARLSIELSKSNEDYKSLLVELSPKMS